MKSNASQVGNLGTDLHDALYVHFDLGLPSFFNIEWLIDAAERGEWSGLWW